MKLFLHIPKGGFLGSHPFKLQFFYKLLRKEHSFIQEQLAKTLGVTVGTVYKWEAWILILQLDMMHNAFPKEKSKRDYTLF